MHALGLQEWWPHPIDPDAGETHLRRRSLRIYADRVNPFDAVQHKKRSAGDASCDRRIRLCVGSSTSRRPFEPHPRTSPGAPFGVVVGRSDVRTGAAGGHQFGRPNTIA